MESESKSINVVLENRQIGYIDRLCADARSTTGVVLGRSQVLRALVDSLAARGINAGKIRSEDDLRKMVA